MDRAGTGSVAAASARSADGKDRVTIDIESDEPGNVQLARVPVEGGDVVRVFAVPRRVRNTVQVKGNVWTPGPQGLTPGMRLSDAIRIAGGPKPDVYLGQILVSHR